MKRGFIFSFTVDSIIMVILMVLMWMIIGLSTDSIVEMKEHSLDNILRDYEDISSSFVLINTKGEHLETVYTCDVNTMMVTSKSRGDSTLGVCPSDLRGVRYGESIVGVKK